jgi:hypothetical protein
VFLMEDSANNNDLEFGKQVDAPKLLFICLIRHPFYLLRFTIIHRSILH